MINKKIPSEIAVGVVLLVAIIIGGAFYLKSKKKVFEVVSENKQYQGSTKQMTPDTNDKKDQPDQSEMQNNSTDKKIHLIILV